MNITQTASTQTNQLQIMSNSSTLTMNTREIAELTGKQHKDVLYDTRKMLDELKVDSATFSAQYKDSTGRTLPMFALPKRESIILVSGYNIQMRAKIVDRWQELEAQQQKNSIVMPNFTDPAEAAIAWATEYKAKQLALQQLEVAKPKVEFVNKFVERGTNRNVTSVAKELGVTAIKLGKWLRAKGYMNKATDKQVWNKEFIDKGYGVQKLFNVEVQDEEFKSGSQALITPAGDVFIKEQIKQYGFTVEVK